MNLMNDFAFKRVFGEPDGARGLVAFLNGILKRPDPIVSVTFENAEIPPVSAEEKTVRLDIAARSDRDLAFDIEMQATRQLTIRKRALLYWSRLFEKQSRRGQGYDVLTPCIAIQILNFTAIESTNAFHTSYHVVENQEGFRLTEELEIHLLELPKFRGSVKNAEKTARDDLGKWLLMMNAAENEGWRKVLEEAATMDPELKETLAVWESASMDDATWKRYNDRDLLLRDFYQYRKEGFEDGIKEGFEDGIREGFEKGIKEGKYAEAVAIARGMLAKGLTVSLIEEITGLGGQAIEALRADAWSRGQT